MGKKYHIYTCTRVLVYPSNSNFLGDSLEETRKIFREGIRLLADEGYEIYQAVPLCSQGTLMVDFILRKEKKRWYQFWK